MTDFQLGWIVGLIEGEGCISVKKSGAYQQVVLHTRMTDEDTIRQAHEWSGVGTVSGPYQDKRPNRKPFWVWNVSSQSECRDFLELILPHLKERRAMKALLALDCLNSQRAAALLRKEA